MFVYSDASRVLVHAPAKINLFLEVLGRRTDGFHEIETLMGAVTIFDTLEFFPRKQGDLRLTCRWAGGMHVRGNHTHKARGRSQPLGDLPSGNQNIVYRAVSRLRQQSAVRYGADIRLTKRIVSAAGLGGASSDAAAALVAANLAWNLHWTMERLSGLAAELGSDIPFFLTEGWAVCRGRGERIETIRGGRLPVVVVRPVEGLETAQVYRHCRPAQVAASVGPLLDCLATGDWRAICRGMLNRLEETARELNTSIGELKCKMQRLGCIAGQMSGSGSSCFGVCRSRRHARRVAAQLRSLHVGEAYEATMAGRGRRQGIASREGDVDSAS